jgi:SAM-dependent methyltransferase
VVRGGASTRNQNRSSTSFRYAPAAGLTLSESCGASEILFELSAIVAGVADPIFEHPRLAAIYDALDPDRSDLDVYVAIAEELGAHHVLDIGCGTGTFALLLADRGFDVTGVDPAGGSLDVARAKPSGERVRWICGTAEDLPPMQVDLATMTGNVAQAIVDPSDWNGTLRGVHDALKPGGHLVFETRDPAKRAWHEWNRAASYKVTEIEGVGAVESWVEVIDVSGPMVTFGWTAVFVSDRQVLTSESTLRFRERNEVKASLLAHRYVVEEVRGAPDRPGQEFVFVARRSQ